MMACRMCTACFCRIESILSRLISAWRLQYMHLNPVRKELVKRPDDWRWSSYNNFALDKATVAACPIQIDYVRLPLGYQV